MPTRRAQRPSRAPRSTRTSDLHRERLARLRALLKRNGHDAFLITNPNDIRYLTGFCGEASYAVVAPRALAIISDGRFTEELRPFAKLADIVIRSGPINAEAARILSDLRAKSIALQADYLTVASRASLAKSVGQRRLRDTTGLLAGLRAVKSDSELAAIRRAARIQEESLLAVLPTIKAGQSEGAIAARLEFEMKSRGAGGTSFDTIVAVGPNSAKPHYRAGPVKAARGRALLIDWVKFDGYCSDMTRTFALGRWPAKLADIYKVVLDAHLAGIDAVRPGRTGHEVDAVARRVLESAGYAHLIGHNLGHGIGLDIHEDPRLAKGSDQVLEPGMIVTVEPGLYLPGVGGVRIEDDIVVTRAGGRNICSLPKDPKWATLHG